jgi:hypothetical protein
VQVTPGIQLVEITAPALLTVISCHLVSVLV